MEEQLKLSSLLLHTLTLFMTIKTWMWTKTGLLLYYPVIPRTVPTYVRLTKDVQNRSGIEFRAKKSEDSVFCEFVGCGVPVAIITHCRTKNPWCSLVFGVFCSKY